MIDFQDFRDALRRLAIPPTAPVIAHASLSAFGEVQGGALTILAALLQTFDTLVMPGFTYKTMITPMTGPANNGLNYGESQDANLAAEFYHPGLPVDRLIGVVAELLRQQPGVVRSSHPILSFVGVGAAEILESQTMEALLKPVERMLEQGGWVLLLGVDQDVNTSIHYGERLAGRKQFVRWALTPAGVVECGGFPGCSDGFTALSPWLAGRMRVEPLGKARIRAIPLAELIPVVRSRVEADRSALLCDRTYCLRCQAVRLEGAAE